MVTSLLNLLDTFSFEIFIYMLKNIVELIIVIAGVYLGYRLNNKHLKKQDEISRQSELMIYKDKFTFNNLIELQNNLREYNDEVLAFFLNVIDVPIDEINLNRELKRKLKQKTDLTFEKILDYKLTLENKLTFHSKFKNEYEEIDLAFERLYAVIYGYYFPSSESKDSGISYEMIRIFTQKIPQNLRKSAKEIYEEQDEEEKELTRLTSQEIKENGEEIIREFYVEHYEAMTELSTLIAKDIEEQFKKLGREKTD